jgi:chromosome segregation protein
LYLKRLEIHGFKTFASRTAFEFRPGVSAIVGPNGSGKSNVVDAIRWVLGEQSQAMLRSRKSEDLIFGGGAKRAASGFAEVSLTIDNSDRTLPVAFDTVTITRRITRSGDHEYFINRAKVRLRDLQEATASLGGSYTIINQGLVDNVLDLRPEERRRLFEDAADISVHEQRRNDAMKRMRETDTNVRRCEDVLVELEPRIRSLKRQASAAKQYRDIKHELDSTQIKLLRLQDVIANTSLGSATQDAAFAQQTLADVQAQRDALNERIGAARVQIRELREQMGAIYGEGSRLHTRAEGLQRSIAVAAERIKAVQQRSVEYAQTVRDAESQQAAVEAEVAALHVVVGQQTDARAAHQTTIDELDRGRVSYNERRRALRTTVDAAQRAEAATAGAIRERQRQLERLQELLAQLDSSQQNESVLVDQAQQALRAQQSQVEQTTLAYTTAQTRAAEREQTITALRTEIDTQRAERATSEEALTAARRTHNQVDSRYQALLQIVRSHGGVAQGVKAAMEYADRTNREFALVSSLITAPQHLELAIETALGARLQHIVTDRWDDAEAAIAALKKNNQGRATFLPLDTIRQGGDTRSPSNAAGVLGVAAQLVDIPAKYRIILDYLLGRTLIVDSLDVARSEIKRISGGWQIVTTGGEQVSSGGSLTGGAQVRDGGTLQRERNLRELPIEVDKAKAEVDRLTAVVGRAGTTIQQLEQRLQQHELARQDDQTAVQDASQARELALRAYNKAEADVALVSQQASQAGQRQADSSAQIAQLSQELLDLSAQQQVQRTALDAAYRDEQALIEQSYAEDDQRAAAQQQLTEAEGQLRATMATIQAAEQRRAALLHTMSQRQARTDELANEATKITRETEGYERELVDVQAEIAAIQTRIAPLEVQLKEAEALLPEQEAAEQQLMTALRAAEADASRAALTLERANDRISVLHDRATSEGYDLGVLSHTAEPIEGDETTLNQQLTTYRNQLQRLGPVNPLALEEYDEANERYTFMNTQVADLKAAAQSLSELIKELDATMRANFEQTFGAVAREFALTFQIMFGGGSASLELTKTGDGGALDDIGIEINARPPGKRQQNLALLSGGERSLTAAALLFAILKVKPTPFCVLDEVDAALDEANVARFRAALDDLRSTSQFVVVTHNRGTIEIADSIYGVSMGDDSASRVLSLRLDELISVAPHLK